MRVLLFYQQKLALDSKVFSKMVADDCSQADDDLHRRREGRVRERHKNRFSCGEFSSSCCCHNKAIKRSFNCIFVVPFYVVESGECIKTTKRN